MKKKILAGILSVSMMLSMFPTGAFAATDHTHHWVDVPAKAATCTDDGYIEHAECDVEGCDAVALKNATSGYRETQAEEIVRKAAGHDYKQVAEKPATCSEKGIKAHLECKVCGEWAVENGTITEPVTDKSSLEIKMLDHDLEKVAVKEATCTEEGVDFEYSKCKVCGGAFVENALGLEKIDESDYISPKKAHDYKQVAEKPATCSEKGIKAHLECKVCGEWAVENGTITEPVTDKSSLEIKMLDHDLEKVAAKEATCTEKGNIEYSKCKDCGKYFVEEGTITVEVKAKDVVIPAKGHEYKDVEEVPATCTSTGVKAHKECTECGKLFVEEGTILVEKTAAELVIPAQEHKLTDVPAKDATCEERGNIAYSKCELCGGLFKVTAAGDVVAIEEKDTVKPATDHFTRVIAEVEPTSCDKPGVKEHLVCENCGKLFLENATGGMREVTKEELVYNTFKHSMVAHEKVEPTCTEYGTKAYYECTSCHKLFADAEGKEAVYTTDLTIAPLGHSMTKHEEVKPTCTETGTKEYYECERCGKIFADEKGETEVTEKDLVISALGHSMTKHEKVEPTCTEYGTKAYYECTSCHKLFADAEGKEAVYTTDLTLAPLGHSMTKHEKVEPTCTEYGTKAYYECTSCHKLFADAEGKEAVYTTDLTLAPLGHSMIKHEEVKPTCTETGTKEYYECETCGKIFADEKGETEVTKEDLVISALGHSMTKHEEVKPTCTEAGTKEYYECETCGKIFADEKGETEVTKEDLVISALGHSMTKHEEVKPTCTEAGTKEYYECETCGKIFADEKGETEVTKEDLVISAPGHSMTKHEEVKATCTEKGVKEYYECSVCGKIFLDKDGKTETTKDGVIVDALGHKTKFVAGVSAGCEKDGTRAHYECEVCGKLFDDAKAENEVSAAALVISATGHHWGEWKVVKAATTKEAGIEQAICDYCGGPWQKEIPVKAASTISAPLYPTKDKRNSDVSSETKDETSSEIKDENDSTSKPDTKADSSDKTQEVGTTPDSSSAAQTENGSSFPIVPLVIAGAALIFLLILLKKRNKEE